VITRLKETALSSLASSPSSVHLAKTPGKQSKMPSPSVKMVTGPGDQLAIAKEAGRRLGLGDYMYPAKIHKDGPPPGSQFASLGDMVTDADRFAESLVSSQSTNLKLSSASRVLAIFVK